MKRKIYLFSFIILLGYSSKCQDNNNVLLNIGKEIMGTYSIPSFNCSYELKLEENERFSHEITSCSCFGGCDIKIIRGKYNVESNRLNLIPETLIITKKEWDSIVSTDTSIYNYKEENYVKKEYQIFTWGHQIFLLSDEYYTAYGYKSEDNDYIGLALYFNWGSYPDGHFFNKENKNKLSSDSFNYSQIPEPYRYLFLKEPIDVEVVGIREIDSLNLKTNEKIERILTFNKGSKDGVYENLYFSNDKYCSLVIIEVKDFISYAVFKYCGDFRKECKVGDKFSTILSENRD